MLKKRPYQGFIRKCWQITFILGASLIFISGSVGETGTSIAQDGGEQKTHVVQSGENLFRIALRYGLSVETLAAANDITDPATIYAGQTLAIPGSNIPAAADEVAAPIENAQPAADTTQTEPAASGDSAPVTHIVEAGQSLASIGRQYGVSYPDIVAWNNITNANTIYAGQRLTIYLNGAPTNTTAVASAAVQEAQPATQTTTSAGVEQVHVVQVGERLASIARRYNVSWPTIARANDLSDPNRIFVGQRLTIPAQDDGQGTFLTPNGGAPSVPAPTVSNGKQVIIDLSDQRIYAYENGSLLKTVIVSTGLAATPTVQGDFRVYWKLTSQAMSGPGYYLPGVPWVMYFYQDYAIHGTYWHNNFGQPMSHGCVNLPTPDAQWFFNWAPVGTPVRVQA
jgi:LysM repeat protein